MINVEMKGPEISLLHMKVLTLIKAKSNVSPWYVQCCTGMRRQRRQRQSKMAAS